MNKKVAIIGSDSYIATQLYHRFEHDDLRLFTYKASAKEGEVVKDLFSIDVNDFIGVDTVINFAAMVHLPEPKDDSDFVRVNTLLPIHLARVAKEAGVKHYVQMSSISVYGDVTQYKEDSPYNPEGVYGRTKLNADQALVELANDKFIISLIRPPMVYGGGLSPGNMQKIIRVAMKGVPLPVKGLNNKRDVIHVYNLIEALLLIIDQSLGGIFLPSDKKSISTEDIVDLTGVYSHTRIRKVVLPAIAKRFIVKLKPILYQKLFGDSKVVCNMPEDYQPKYKLEDGIEDIVRAIEQS